MCLLSAMEKPSIIDNNVTVYKIMILRKKDNVLLSPYYYHEWKLGKEETEDIFGYHNGIGVKNTTMTYRVEMGFHSYSNLELAKYRLEQVILINKDMLNTLERKVFAMQYKMVLVECIIPKGSRYWISDDCKEYCTNKLKPDKILKT